MTFRLALLTVSKVEDMVLENGGAPVATWARASGAARKMATSKTANAAGLAVGAAIRTGLMVASTPIGSGRE